MGRKTIADVLEELEDERADNERLVRKVQELREVVAELEGDDDGEEVEEVDADD
jgi:cell division protein FtsB